MLELNRVNCRGLGLKGCSGERGLDLVALAVRRCKEIIRGEDMSKARTVNICSQPASGTAVEICPCRYLYSVHLGGGGWK